jgi:type I restriction enzyme, S subunit
MAKLEDYCFISSGGTPSRSKKSFYGGSILWATISDIEKSNGIITDTKEKITKEGLSSIGNKLFPKNTLLLSMYGSIGKTAIAGTELATNQAILGIRPKNKDEIYLPFLSYWLQLNTKMLKHQARGGILQNLSVKIVRNLKIDFPDYDTQMNISQLLSKIENLIQKRENGIKLLDKLIRSIFFDIFGNPINNSKNLETLKIGTFTDVLTGATPNRKNAQYYTNGTINWIKTTEVQNNYILSCSEKITTLAASETNCKIFPINTIMLAMYGEGRTRGQVGLLQIKATSNQACSAILPNNLFSHIVLFYQLQYMYQLLRKLARGGARPNLNLSMIKNLEVISPLYKDNENIKKFEIVVKKIEKTKKNYQDTLLELKELFGSVSQKAFKGELDVIELDIKDKGLYKSKNVITQIESNKIELPKNSKIIYKETFTKDFLKKEIIVNLERNELIFDEICKLFKDNNYYDIPYDKKADTIKIDINFKDIIFELLKNGEIIQKFDKTKQKIVLKSA